MFSHSTCKVVFCCCYPLLWLEVRSSSCSGNVSLQYFQTSNTGDWAQRVRSSLFAFILPTSFPEQPPKSDLLTSVRPLPCPIHRPFWRNRIRVTMIHDREHVPRIDVLDKRKPAALNGWDHLEADEFQQLEPSNPRVHTPSSVSDTAPNALVPASLRKYMKQTTLPIRALNEVFFGDASSAKYVRCSSLSHPWCRSHCFMHNNRTYTRILTVITILSVKMLFSTATIIKIKSRMNVRSKCVLIQIKYNSCRVLRIHCFHDFFSLLVLMVIRNQ